MLAPNRKQCFRVGVELLQRIRRMRKRHHHEHHALVAGGEVVQELLGFLALQFHIIRYHGAEIVRGVLLTLPVGHVGFDTQELILHLPHSLIRGDGDNVDGEHEVAVQFAQF